MFIFFFVFDLGNLNRYTIWDLVESVKWVASPWIPSGKRLWKPVGQSGKEDSG